MMTQLTPGPELSNRINEAAWNSCVAPKNAPYRSLLERVGQYGPFKGHLYEARDYGPLGVYVLAFKRDETHVATWKVQL